MRHMKPAYPIRIRWSLIPYSMGCHARMEGIISDQRERHLNTEVVGLTHDDEQSDKYFLFSFDITDFY